MAASTNRPSGDAAGDHIHHPGTRAFPHKPLAQLDEDDVVHQPAVVRRRHHDVDAGPGPHAPGVEAVLHRVAGGEEQRAPAPRGGDVAARLGDDVDQRHAGGALHRLGDEMHGVGADQQQLRTRCLEAPSGIYHQLGERVPIATVLKGFDL